MNNISNKTVSISQLSLFIAIIALMAFIPFLGYIPLGFSRATIVHIPVILGSIILGPKNGAILGFVFGLTSFLVATFTPDITAFAFTPFYSIGNIHGNFFSLIICFVPRILVGIVPYYIYNFLCKLIQKENYKQTLALCISGIIGSLTNTLLVMNLIFLFFKDNFAQINNVSVDAVYLVILSIIAINGIPEAIVASILTLVIGKALLRIYKQ